MAAVRYRGMSLVALGGFARVVLQHSKRSGNEKILSSIFFTILEERFARFEAALLRKNVTNMGAELKQADTLRTNIYRGIYQLLRGYEALGGNEGRAAETLLSIVRTQKSVLRMSYSTKSEVLRKFIKEFSLPANKSLLEELGLAAYFERLCEAQDSFDSLMSGKQDALSSLRQMEWASRLRPELIEVLRNYLSFVEMMRHDPSCRDLYFDLEQAKITANDTRRTRAPKKTEPSATAETSATAPDQPAESLTPAEFACTETSAQPSAPPDNEQPEPIVKNEYGDEVPPDNNRHQDEVENSKTFKSDNDNQPVVEHATG